MQEKQEKPTLMSENLAGRKFHELHESALHSRN